jgi:hypothetical protein
MYYSIFGLDFVSVLPLLLTVPLLSARMLYSAYENTASEISRRSSGKIKSGKTTVDSGNAFARSIMLNNFVFFAVFVFLAFYLFSNASATT